MVDSIHLQQYVTKIDVVDRWSRAATGQVLSDMEKYVIRTCGARGASGFEPRRFCGCVWRHAIIRLPPRSGGQPCLAACGWRELEGPSVDVQSEPGRRLDHRGLVLNCGGGWLERRWRRAQGPPRAGQNRDFIRHGNRQSASAEKAMWRGARLRVGRVCRGGVREVIADPKHPHHRTHRSRRGALP